MGGEKKKPKKRGGGNAEPGGPKGGGAFPMRKNATSGAWDGFFDTMLPTNPCGLWRDAGERPPRPANVTVDVAKDRESANIDPARSKGAPSPGRKGGNGVPDAYERVDHDGSLTVDEVLCRAAAAADLGSHALWGGSIGSSSPHEDEPLLLAALSLPDPSR